MNHEVRERIYLTSNKRAVVPEGDPKASFLLATPGPISPAKEKEIRSFRGGANYLHKIGSAKAGKPEGDTAGQPEADKGGQPDADKGGKPQDDKSGQPEADKTGQASGAVLGPDDTVTFGRHEGALVRDLPEKYLKNLARINKDHQPMAEAELARRAEETD